MTVKFDNVVCCGWSSDPNDVTYGTLVEKGLMTKEYVGYYGEDILWTVIGDVEFTDNFGEIHRKGDKILWNK